MGALRFWLSDGDDPVLAEYDRISRTWPRQTAYLLARLAAVVKLGPKEAEEDEIQGEPGYFLFERHPACVVYRVTSQAVGADVLVLAFSDFRSESFDRILRRAKLRDP